MRASLVEGAESVRSVREVAHSVFIDGAAGTTGLEIRERLQGRAELKVVQLSEADRKDVRAAPVL